MSDFIIRMAKSFDVPALLPLMDQLGYPTTNAELHKRFETFVSFEGYGVAVASEEPHIIGWVAWSKSELFILGKTRIHIEGLIVDRNYRGKGIGKKLMLFVEEAAKKYSPVIIDLTSGLRRAKEGTHDFYKSLGYHNEGYMAKLYLRKEIDA